MEDRVNPKTLADMQNSTLNNAHHHGSYIYIMHTAKTLSILLLKISYVHSMCDMHVARPYEAVKYVQQLDQCINSNNIL